jgi:hypothetical protein
MTKPDLEALRAKLKTHPNLTQVEKVSGIPRSTIRSIRDGDTENPGYLTVVALEAALACLPSASGGGEVTDGR